MFIKVNKSKLTQIVFTAIAFITFTLTIKLISNRDIDHNLKRINYTYLESIANKRPKIFCMITTTAKNHESKAIHVRNTWAKRCDQFLFFSSEDNSSLPSVRVCNEDDRSHLWCKTKSALIYIHDNYVNHFDWFLKADDDSYVIVDNLRHFLSGHSPNDPLYFGCKFSHNDVTYMSGGAGYVLSRTAVKRFVRQSLANFNDTSSCRAKADIGPEDLELGRCLQSVGVVAGDSRDESLSARFLPFDPIKLISPNTNLSRLAPWFKTYSVYPHRTGPDCCSSSVISFHYVPPDIMYLMDFLLYKVKVSDS